MAQLDLPRNSQDFTLDLGAYQDPDVKVYSGRPRGEMVRQETGLDRLDVDSRYSRIIVRFPDDTWDVGSSFWLGMFAPSVEKLGADQFRARYCFTGGIRHEDVDAGIEDALMELNPLSIPSETRSRWRF